MVGEQTRHRRRRFPPRPSSVGEARRMVRESLLEAGREDLFDTAELLVSEIVTNALVHAGTHIDVAFSFVGRGVRVEVTDGSPHVPSPRSYGPTAGTGRGLMLLEQMVDEWGVLAEDPGKTVWFQLACGDAALEVDEEGAGGSGGHAETLTVELIDVPLLLHEAWRQHAESLLREYLLASLDLDGPADPIAVHAEASDAIALLAEHIPPSGVGEEPDRVMVTATEPLVTSPLVKLPVPPDSVHHFETLDRTLDAALRMVDGGGFLTPPTQPELQALRSWFCGQVAAQSEGAVPVPWSSPEDPALLPHGGPLTWDSGPVEEATYGALAADDADRVVAVSRPALELLGYDDPGQLVGRRLVEVVPERYRQAHLTGFTMHFLTGRALFIGHAVVVPALRRDGSEVEVEMVVELDRSAEGRTVFVARLEAAGDARVDALG